MGDADRRKRLRDQSQNFSLQKLSSYAERTIDNLMSTEEEKFSSLLFEHQNLVFNELSKFVSFFINLQMPYEQSHKMLIEACSLYSVNKEKQALLVTELRQNQRCQDKMFTEHEIRICSLQKRSNRLRKYGLNEVTLILGCTVKFIDSDCTLMKLLLSSRDVYECLKPSILKQALLSAS